MIIRNQLTSLMVRSLALFGMLMGFVVSSGCEVDNYMDPSKTGYFEFAPTTIPVLDRLDVVEVDELPFGEITEPNPEDLVPSSLVYRLAPGDVVKCEIYELVSAGQMDISVRIVDQAGQIRLPTLGDVPAAGLSLEELQKEIEDRLQGLINDPLVTVAIESGRSFQFTIYGSVSGTGMYSLDRPDFRVMNALALAGGTMSTTQYVYIIRELALNELVKPAFDRREKDPGEASGTDAPKTDAEIEALINQLQSEDGAAPSPGMVASQDDPLVDLDDVESAPTPVADGGSQAAKKADDKPASNPASTGAAVSSSGYRYDEE